MKGQFTSSLLTHHPRTALLQEVFRTQRDQHHHPRPIFFGHVLLRTSDASILFQVGLVSMTNSFSLERIVLGAHFYKDAIIHHPKA